MIFNVSALSANGTRYEFAAIEPTRHAAIHRAITVLRNAGVKSLLYFRVKPL